MHDERLDDVVVPAIDVVGAAVVAAAFEGTVVMDVVVFDGIEEGRTKNAMIAIMTRKIRYTSIAFELTIQTQ
jgi:hypothetical protein